MKPTARVNTLLDAEYVTGDVMTLHSAFSATGLNEITGGSYAPQSLTYGAAANRAKAVTGAVLFAGLAAGVTVAWIGIWNSTKTTLKRMAPNAGNGKAFQVDVTNNRIYCEGIGAANNDRITFTGQSLPGGLTEGALLYAVGVTAGDPDYIQVSATLGGAAIDITDATMSRDACVSKVVVDTLASASDYSIDSFSITE